MFPKTPAKATRIPTKIPLKAAIFFKVLFIFISKFPLPLII